MQPKSPSGPHRIPTVIVVLVAGWIALAAYGFTRLHEYAARPGGSDVTRADWPSDSRIPSSTGNATLVMFLHPACPCSRASVEELARIMTRKSRAMDTYVLFIRPRGLAAGWERTDLWEAAARIADVNVRVDPGGREARRFGAATSGHAMLYAGSGELIFHGGITAARGHEGDSFGKSAILNWFRKGRTKTREAPVFGCPLFDGPAI